MKEGTLYRHILKQSWQITWKNKILWILGFLAVFWGGIGSYGIFNKVIEVLGPTPPQWFVDNEPLLPSLQGLTISGWILLIFIALAVIAVILIGIMLVTAGRGGLVWAVFCKKEKSAVTLSSALLCGMSRFWPLLAIGVIIHLDILAYGFLLDPFVKESPGFWGVALYAAIFTLLSLISIVLSFLGIYAAAFVVLEKQSLVQSIKGAVRLFIRNWLVSLESAVLLYLINIAVGIAALIGLFVLAVPFVLLFIILALLKLAGGVWFILIPAALIYVALVIAAGSVLVAFQYAYWTLLFLRIRDGSALAKILRLTSRFGRVMHRKIV